MISDRGGGRLRSVAAVVLMVALVAGCRTTERADLPPVGEARMDVFHKQCIKSGGDYLRFGTGKTFICEAVPGDAGKYCTKASDCESACLARSHSCAPVKPLLGCNDVLTDDGSTVTQCIN